MDTIDYIGIKYSYTEIRNEIIQEIEIYTRKIIQVNDFSKLRSDIGLNEFDISDICYLMNTRYNLKFMWKEIQNINTIGELTFFYYKLINDNR